MKIYQILTTVAFGDAVSNDTIAIDKSLKINGFDTQIYAENIDHRLEKGLVLPVSELPLIEESDMVLYHFSTGTPLNERVAELSCKKIMRYHNITPCQFFEDYSITAYDLCDTGRKQLAKIYDKFDYCLADSEYNKQELEELHFTCPIEVLPILIPFEDYEKTPDSTVLEKYSDGYTNILFTGRIAPNKKQEDVIAAFYKYHTIFNKKSRLILVGNDGGMEAYSKRLHNYVKELGIEDSVIFPGHISFSAILAFYKVADIFLCQSEHEGFCVPLIEAMIFDTPIIAYRSSAIPWTAGKAGIMLEEKNPLETGAMIDYLMKHDEVKKQLVLEGKNRLKDFNHDVIEKRIIDIICDMH